ncbi:MAG: hypothetical protein QF921_03480 [Pseudomonadales bacterium]|nr:hypothetical protein [Pseudomonadales bacterium]MDP6472814.1 hypothetical protein [Pseudomonadales bacterium]MDP6828030.1 hypothetical protein [Pseudomonadales bacterium]MDP6970570.1 hypothetical protein [Pseudomonadales bacterium]
MTRNDTRFISGTEVIWVGTILILLLGVLLVSRLQQPGDDDGSAASGHSGAWRPLPVDEQRFLARAQSLIDRYAVEDDEGRLVTKPPPGTDLYLVGELWKWWPTYQLEQGRSYRLHLSSIDWIHGFSMLPELEAVPVLPGYEVVVALIPRLAGVRTITCSEYCGVGHEEMIGTLHIVRSTGAEVVDDSR